MKQLLFFILVASISLPSCWDAFGKRVRGNGNVTTENRSIDNFTGISSHGAFDVLLVQDSTYKVSIEAEDNLLPYIETYVEDGTLKIRTKDGYNLHNTRALKVHVSAPTFTTIKSVGSGDIIAENKINNTAAMELETTGSGNIKANLNAPEIKAEVTGSGSINLQGETRTFNGEILGSGDIRAYDLKSENVGVDIRGSGNVEVFASVKLSVDISGSGDVKYKGAGQVASSIHGSGSVRKVD
jgi:hypothetical protein